MAEQSMLLPIPVKEKDRFSILKENFRAKFNADPLFYVRLPGRVNLIGEHIDYCGYGVLPMAIEQDVVVAVCARNDQIISLTNTLPKYNDFSCSISDMGINKANPQWFHYFLCGVKGMADYYGSNKKLQGMNIAVDGRVPPSAGLSSSSALVCAAALATAKVNSDVPSKEKLAELCAKAEHYIGTEGGGMDQSISFLAEAGTAKYIEFNPLRLTNVLLPNGATFVVSNSCAEINKAASSHFNSRVAEVRLASQVLAKLNGLKWQEINTLGKLQMNLEMSVEQMETIVKKFLHQEPYSKEEICKVLDVTTKELDNISLSERTWDLKEFKLYNRALHVYSEASRVCDFKKACDEKPEGILKKLGQLMNQSHASCRDLYECSAPALDSLCELALKSGALGSRLTGAGWGGCCVSLVPEESLSSFLEEIKNGYYMKDPTLAEKISTSLFASQPGHGAAIYEA